MLHQKLQIQKSSASKDWTQKGDYEELELMVSLLNSSLFLPSSNGNPVISYPLTFKEKSTYRHMNSPKNKC